MRSSTVLISALVLAIAGATMHMAWAKDSPQEHTLPINGMKMHYRTLGEGPPLVLLH